LTGAKPLLHNKSVLLTIDDARSSVWRFAYPLLKKYQMNAVVFIIPGWTKDSSDQSQCLKQKAEIASDKRVPGEISVCSGNAISNLSFC
jgi:peptidoglycan/xylan/chitin deacetylase (PgdA/CDA1 family)